MACIRKAFIERYSRPMKAMFCMEARKRQVDSQRLSIFLSCYILPSSGKKCLLTINP